MVHSRPARIAVLALAALASLARADSWLDGYSAYRKGDYKEALPVFQAAAARGDAKAMNYLGQMFASGHGVRKDMEEAARWFRLAAGKGDAGGQNNLGELYASGWGVPKDYESAARWFTAAADQGDPTALFNLGKMRASGLGVERDLDLAAEYFRRVLKSDPKNEKVRNWLGAVYHGLGRHEAAVEQFSALTQAGGRPEDVWHYYLGMSLLGLDRLEEARSAFQSGLEDTPAHNMGVDRRKEIKERLEAIESYKGHYQSALAHLSARRSGAARGELLAAQKAVRTVEVGERLAALDAAEGPGGAGARALWGALLGVPALAAALGWILLRRGKHRTRPNAADRGITRGSVTEPFSEGMPHPGVFGERPASEALGAAEEEDPEAGLAALERVPRASWGGGEYRAALKLYRRLGRFDAALAVFGDIQRTMSLDAAADLHYRFALFCERAGRVEKAKEILRNLCSALGSYKDARTRLRGLEALSASETGRVTLTWAGGGEPGPPSSEGGRAPFPQGAAAKGPRPELLIGGRFQILSPLGRGGMGYVYKARDLKLPRDVALKKMRDEIARNPSAKARFMEEARTLAQLNHEHIVVLHDFVESEGETYLVFEHVDGEPVSELIAARGSIPAKETAQLLRMVCHALAFAHERKIIHRDLKPSNIMKNRKGIAKVLDFGLAAHVFAADSAQETVHCGPGTPLYMAPEQHAGAATYQSDIYSLGVTAYEMLSGEVPFKGGDFLRRKSLGAYEALPGSVPESLRRLVEACLKPEPEKRPQSMREADSILREAA